MVYDTRPAFQSTLNAECRLMKTISLLPGTAINMNVQVKSIRGYLISTVTTQYGQTSILVFNTTSNNYQLFLNNTIQDKQDKHDDSNITPVFISTTRLVKGLSIVPTTVTNIMFSLPSFHSKPSDTSSKCTGSNTNIVGYQSLLSFTPAKHDLIGFDLQILRLPMLIIAVVGAFWYYRRSSPLSRRNKGGGMPDDFKKMMQNMQNGYMGGGMGGGMGSAARRTSVDWNN